MRVVEHSSGAVESSLSSLDEVYEDFSVNQTTIPVPETQYEHERERAATGRIDLYAKVCNDDGEVLHLTREETEQLPSTTVDDEESFERAICHAVSETVGIDCRVTGVEEATILGVADAENNDRETIWRLAVLFEAAHQAGTVDEQADWRGPSETVEPTYF